MTSRVITLAMPVLVNFIILLVWLFNSEYENVLFGKKKGKSPIFTIITIISFFGYMSWGAKPVKKRQPYCQQSKI